MSNTSVIFYIISFFFLGGALTSEASEFPSFNVEEYKEKCSSFYEFQACVSETKNLLSQLDLKDLSDFSKYSMPQQHIISFFFLYLGQNQYYGFETNSPNLSEGIAHFIISGFLGNEIALFTLSTCIQNDIIIQVKSDLLSKIQQNKILEDISKTKFFNNFIIILNDPAVETKDAIATSFLFSSALAKYPPAMNAVGYKYLRGYGLEKSCDNALKYYQESSHETVKEKEQFKTRFLYLDISLEEKEYILTKLDKDDDELEQKIEYFSLLASQGNIDSIKKLADMYLFGIKVKQDLKQAFNLFKKGAQLNDTSCIYYLGEMHLYGWGTAKNYTEAKRLFEVAKDANYLKAWNSLGYMYYYGYGVPRNVRRAYDFFKKSFTNGNVDLDGYYNFATMLLESNKTGLESDYAEAYKYIKNIAVQGHLFGTYFYAMMNKFHIGSTLSICYLNIDFFRLVSERNIHTKKKWDLALKFYDKKKFQASSLVFMELAEEGIERAQINAALLLKNYKIFIDQKYQMFLSFKFFKMAAGTGNSFAFVMLGDIYLYGFGGQEKDTKKALKYYNKLKQPIHKDIYKVHAYFRKSLIFNYGYGVEKNITKANLYLKELAKGTSPVKYPAYLMLKYNELKYDYSNLSKDNLKSTLLNLFSLRWKIWIFLSFVIFYVFFYISIRLQKE